jgi:PAS domain S-box-containing protein
MPESAPTEVQSAEPEPRGRRERWSIKAYLATLTVVVIAGLATLSYVQHQSAVSTAHRHAIEDASYAANTAAGRLSDGLSATQAAVISAGETPDLRARIDALAPDEECPLTFSPGHLDVVTPDGRVVCSSLAVPDGPVYAGALWLEQVQAAPVILGPVEDARTGAPAVVVAAPLNGGGAVVAFLDLKQTITEFARDFSGRRNLLLLVTSADGGTVIMRSKDFDRWVDQPIANTVFATDPERTEHPDIDGVNRLYGYADVDATGWRVFAGADEKAALAGVDEITDRDIKVAVAITLLFLIATFVGYRKVGRPILRLSSRVREATAHRHTNPIDLAGPREVVRLANDFNDLVLERDRELAEVSELAVTKAAILQSAMDSVVTIDGNGVIVEFNPAAERTFGYRRDEAMGREMAELLIPPRHRDAHRAGLSRYLDTGDARILRQRLELTGMRADGSEFPVELTVTDVALPGGPMFTGYLRDLTEDKRVRFDLAKSEERLRAILDNSPAIVYFKDRDGRYLFVNREFEAAYGLTRDEVTGRTDGDIWPEAIALRNRMSDEEVLAAGEALQFEDVVTHDDESRTYLSVRFPLVDTGGDVYATAGIATDITDRKKAEAERKTLQERRSQMQRLESLGQLAAGVAHDFNNLLGVILNYASFVAEETQGDVRADVGQIQAAAERATRLTKQLLIFGRRETVQPELLDLNAIVNDIHLMLSRTIGENIDLRLNLAPDLPAFRADRGQVDQILLNLAVNARDAMPEGGTLTIESRAVDVDNSYADLNPSAGPGHYVQLSVSDTGTGMTPDVAARVFEPFYSTKPQGQGTGLGLATVYGIVTESSGAINVYSEPGIGTIFRVYFPAVDLHATTARPADPSAPEIGETCTVLLVEDEPAMLEVTARMLRRNGFDVLTASGPEEAIMIAGQVEFQVIVTDSVMPGMSGPMMVAQLAPAHPEVAVLYMSGYTDGVLGPRRIVTEDVALIQKPFTEADLIARLREVLASHRIAVAGAALAPAEIRT